MKRYLTLFIIREIPIKTKPRCHISFIRLTNLKSLTIYSVGKTVGKEAFSYMVWKQYKMVQALYGGNLVISRKITYVFIL